MRREHQALLPTARAAVRGSILNEAASLVATRRIRALAAVAVAVSLSTACGWFDPHGTPAQPTESSDAGTTSTGTGAEAATATGVTVETSLGGTPAATPTASKPSGATGKVNSVATIIGDMTLENDSRADGIPNFMWATGPNPAAVLMGADPRGSKMQPWWLNLSNVWSQYKDADLWSTYVQWFLIFEGVGNGADNVRVEVRNPRTYYLSRSTGQWIAVGGLRPGSHWFQAWKSDLTWANDNVDLRRNADGSVAVRVPLNSPNTIHGVWEQGKIDISQLVADMSALFVTVQARLVVDDPSRPDDRAAANLLLHVGGDYYPDMSATAANSFPPGAGVSRLKRITSEWQSFNFATIDAARQDYTGSSASISTAAFRNNPPPLE